MEPEGSSPYSQLPTTCPYPEPNPSSPHNLLPIPEDPSEYYPPTSIWVSPMVCFPQISHQKSVHPSPLPHTHHMPPHLMLFDFTTCTIFGKEYRSLSYS